MTRVYHGSDHIIEHPQYLGGKKDNDYGNGFYTTEYEDRARSWAGLNGTPEKSIVNVYDLQLDKLKTVDLNEQGVLAWIAEVVSNRGISEENAAIVGERMKAILLDGFQVPGITARYAIQNRLRYQGGGTYDHTGI